MMAERVALVTGASGGIGAEIVTRLNSSGWIVFGGSRNPERSDPRSISLDVTDDASVRSAITGVVDRTGRLDALVNNAGVDIAGAVEETSVAEAEALFAVNFFGVHRVTRAALPHLRKTGGGRLVVMGSLAGLVPVPFDACYTASKHALEGWIDALQAEVAEFGIRCTIIEPGFVRTRLRERKTPAEARLGAYADARQRVEAAFDRSVAAGASPDRVARVVAEVLASRRPPLHRKVGSDARRIAALRTVLPDRMFQHGLQRRG